MIFLNKGRKWLFGGLLALLACAGLSGCGGLGNRLNKFIPNDYESAEEHFDPNGWQDYTDYCKYLYTEEMDSFFSQSRQYYVQVEEETIEMLLGYFDNFAAWMEAGERLSEYDFDAACVTVGDFYYISTKEGEKIGRDSVYEKYDNYTVYFYDIETHTLYYMHTNI